MKLHPRLTFVAFNVSDLAASERFYRTILGLPLHASAHDTELDDPWYGGRHAACSWTDGAFLHFALYPARQPERPVTTAAQIGFHVDEFELVHERAVAAGLTVVSEPREEPWGTTVRYVDPDSNVVSVTRA